GEVDHDGLTDRQDHDAYARRQPAHGCPRQRVGRRREREDRAGVQHLRQANHRLPAHHVARSADGGDEKELDDACPSGQPLFSVQFLHRSCYFAFIVFVSFFVLRETGRKGGAERHGARRGQRKSIAQSRRPKGGNATHYFKAFVMFVSLRTC
ncbi:unnamed protein product, partial [Ectocarpus sp. 12 AP-2014]